MPRLTRAPMPPAVVVQGFILLWLPLPARILSPNASRGESRWRALVKAKAVKNARLLARLLMENILTHHCLSSRQFRAGYSLAFFWPTRAYRDDDNADASCKAYRDGICQALGIDDRHFRKIQLSTHAKDPVCPRLGFYIHRYVEAE